MTNVYIKQKRGRIGVSMVASSGDLDAAARAVLLQCAEHFSWTCRIGVDSRDDERWK